MASEPEALYFAKDKLSSFSVTDFNSLSQNLLFTQLEWAAILHISDRTLQRYLKEGKPFQGLYAEHLYQLENMAALGIQVFENAKLLDEWLRQPKTVLDKIIDFSALQSFWGVKLVSNELGRLEHGVYI
jgi:putative toxin-antitoxin system antitoxin component (TIGR02293 family)